MVALPPIIQRIVNATPHATTGVAPIRLMFGDAVTPDRLMFGDDEDEEEEEDESSVEDYVQGLNKASRRLVQQSRDHQDRVIAEYLSKSPAHPTEFEVGQLVLVSYPDRPPSKLSPRWQGPMAVVSREGVRYDVQDLLDMSIKSVHVSRLKAYVADQTDDPRAVAAADTSEYLVDAIIAHRGDPPDLLFRVRWLGYPPEEDTWLPRSQLRDVAQFRAYLLAHPEVRL